MSAVSGAYLNNYFVIKYKKSVACANRKTM